MDIAKIRQYCSSREIEWTLHVAKRLLQRGISSDDVVSSLQSGEIIENYPEDYPFPSCLVMGSTIFCTLFVPSVIVDCGLLRHMSRT